MDKNSNAYNEFIQALNYFNKTVNLIQEKYHNQLEIQFVVPERSEMKYMDGDKECTDKRYLFNEMSMIAYTNMSGFRSD